MSFQKRLIVWLGVLFAAQVGLPQATSPQLSSQDVPSPIAIKISVSPNPVKLGSDIHLTITVTNVTATPVTVAAGTTSELNRIEVLDEMGRPIAQKKYFHIRTLTAWELNPGESYTGPGVLLNRLYEINKVGRYFVQVRRVSRYEPELHSENARSNVLTITVSP